MPRSPLRFNQACNRSGSRTTRRRSNRTCSTDAYITVIVDPHAPSRDIVAGGMIQRVAPEPNAPPLPSASTLDAVRSYAGAGLWYDAIAVISDLIAAHPHYHRLREQRASLLRQVGLFETAEWDLRQADRP